MRTTSKFWPFDPDPELEIYENPSWDLPGRARFQTRYTSRRKPARPHSR